MTSLVVSARTLGAWLAAVLATICSLLAGPAYGGGGPENVFVVVNSASWASQTVANHFIALRQIPSCNVFYIEWDEGTDLVKGETFRQKILAPAMININNRKLTDQIDCIVYSSDFPYQVDLTADLAGQKTPPHQSPKASLNGATYLWQYVLGHNPMSISLKSNQYMRSGSDRKTFAPTHGFRSWYGWNPEGALIDSGGVHYILSTVIGVTSGRGNSVREVISYLERSAKADGSHPTGTVYFMKNADVRSTTRSGGFDQAARELERLNVAADVLTGILPMGKPDVMGAMIGASEFDWGASGSTILPGAICEHFTSFGGQLSDGAGQTPLTQFLRYGAAGASGTVAEPMSVQDKFPVPAIHVHYAQGCTLAESYYQSVFAPYQLLIVGDPLCSPWADIPKVEVADLKVGDRLKGQREFKVSATFATNTEVDHFELFVDGKRYSIARPDQSLPLDTRELADGFHELRFVAVGAKPIETQGRLIVTVGVENENRRVTLAKHKNTTLRWDKLVKFAATATGLKGVVFFHNGRVIGKFSGDSGEIEVNPRIFGLGPIWIEALGIGSESPDDRVAATPLRFDVEPSSLLPALKGPAAEDLKRGLMLKADSRSKVIDSTLDPLWLRKAGVKPGEEFELSGYFTVDVGEVQQFQVTHDGKLSVIVDRTPIYSEAEGNYKLKFLPVALAPGLHRVTLRGKAGPVALVRALYGGPGSLTLSKATFSHTTQ